MMRCRAITLHAETDLDACFAVRHPRNYPSGAIQTKSKFCLDLLIRPQRPL
jgi:hypothetical protein